MPALHHLVFYRPDALPAAQSTASKHWRQLHVLGAATNTVKYAYKDYKYQLSLIDPRDKIVL